jgi:hypothetical protein
MKARRLIERASFDPDQFKIIGQAFDQAWEQLAPQVSGRAEAFAAARLKLANAVLAVAKTGPIELERIKTRHEDDVR